MGRLKELLAEANLDLEAITASKAEARRLLHHASKINLDEVKPFNDPHQGHQPA